MVNAEATAVLVVFRNARRRTNIGVRRPPGINLQHRHSSVDGERMADYIARPRTAQPQHGRGDLLGLARWTNGNILLHLSIRFFVPLLHRRRAGRMSKDLCEMAGLA